MLKIIEPSPRPLSPNLSSDIFAIEALETVTAQDYQEVLVPVIEKAHSEGKKIRFLFYLGPKFEGFTPGAGWEDLKLGYRYLKTFERCAVVTDHKWIRSAVQFVGGLIPCAVKVFENSELDAAKDWLDSGEIGLDLKFDQGTEVLKIEISEPLTSQNFDILATKVDEWIEGGGKVNGLVIHLKKFPGWENLGSFISHVNFVKNHHRKIRHVALCANGVLPQLAPELAKYFVEAKVMQFDYDKLGDAMAWAAAKS